MYWVCSICIVAIYDIDEVENELEATEKTEPEKSVIKNDPNDAEQDAKEEPIDDEKYSDVKPIPAPRRPVPAPRSKFRNPFFGKLNNFSQLVDEKLDQQAEEENTGFAITK